MPPPSDPKVIGLLSSLRLSARGERRARAVIGRAVAADGPAAADRLPRRPPHRDLEPTRQVQAAARTVAAGMAAYLGQHLCRLGIWYWVARSALEGRFESGIWIGLLLLFATLAILQAVSETLLGDLGLHFGAWLKRRWLWAALAGGPGDRRRRGAGAALASVLESDALETLALSGGLMALTAALELPVAVWVTHRGPAPIPPSILLGTFLLGLVWLGRRYHSAQLRLAGLRVPLTHHLVEKMAGHETRRVQEPAANRHREEQAELGAYARASAGVDRWQLRLEMLPWVWRAAGVAAILPALVAGASAPRLALALGGVLLAEQALDSASRALRALSRAAVSHRYLDPVPRPKGAAGGGVTGIGPAQGAVAGGGHDGALLEARNLSFTYPSRGRPSLEDVALRIEAGERWLIEGPSGGGKSTLAALLAGLRRPDAGSLRLYGLDLGVWGTQSWRRSVVLVPQFHDNYMFTETLAFNLLMGRGWPPSRRDMEDADRICRELGLGELLERMPSGLHQIVGENGWQLSHGEQSRVFLARALLQDPAMVVLDESLAALDPESSSLCMASAKKRCSTLAIVTHPSNVSRRSAGRSTTASTAPTASATAPTCPTARSPRSCCRASTW